MNPLFAKRLQVERWLARRIIKKPLALTAGQGVVTFSFDDAPRTACTTGRKILEDADCLATYYIAGGLMNGEEMGRSCHTAADLQSLRAAGHHLGCHTWGHQRCDLLTRAGMQEEIRRNKAFLTDFGVSENDRHFCYPLGGYHLASKSLVSQHFLSGRLNFGGMQVGVADLNALRALSLYEHLWEPESLPALMAAVAANRAWLILYTHDVEETPSQYGCTPQLLRAAVQHALAAGCKVMPVNQAIQYWQGSQPN